MSKFFRKNSDSEDSDSDSSDEEALLSSGDEQPKKPKSSFLKGDDGDDSDSDSDDDDLDDDSDDSDKPAGAKKPAGSRFLRGDQESDDDSDEDVKKIVKSANAKQSYKFKKDPLVERVSLEIDAKR